EVAVNLADIESNRLEIALLADEVFFSGHLTALETRISPNSAPRTILLATGTAPDGASLPAIPLRFGAEMESGSVHRTAQAWTAHGVCGALELRLNSQIDVTTHDPAFDGQFRVIELWHRFDASSGGTVEFIAER